MIPRSLQLVGLLATPEWKVGGPFTWGTRRAHGTKSVLQNKEQHKNVENELTRLT